MINHWSFFDTLDLQVLRDQVKSANPEIRFILSVNDQGSVLNNSSSIRHNAARNLSELMQKVRYFEM